MESSIQNNNFVFKYLNNFVVNESKYKKVKIASNLAQPFHVSFGDMKARIYKSPIISLF